MPEPRIDEKHGMSRTMTYQKWESMKKRCNGKDPLSVKYYQELGITYDPRWELFSEFYRDMGECPDGLSLDRINSKLGYYKENCRWTTRSEQSFNTKKQENNTSGRTGVIWLKREKRWLARIEKDRKVISLGYFKNYDDACAVRAKAEIEYFGYNKD